MYNAKIKDNKPICAKCGNDKLSNVREYKEIIMDDIKYVLFQVKCYKCNADNRYLADVNIDYTTRYEVNHKISDVKDE